MASRELSHTQRAAAWLLLLTLLRMDDASVLLATDDALEECALVDGVGEL